MTKDQSDEVIRRFLAGETCEGIGLYFEGRNGCRPREDQFHSNEAQEVIRGYMKHYRMDGDGMSEKHQIHDCPECGQTCDCRASDIEGCTHCYIFESEK
jgi:protein-arginine kinase activator protein McsA